MALETTRRREFAELVADHVLSEVDRNELLAVMYSNGVANHFRYDGRPARPGLVNLLFVSGVHSEDRFVEVIVDERSFFL